MISDVFAKELKTRKREIKNEEAARVSADEASKARAAQETIDNAPLYQASETLAVKLKELEETCRNPLLTNAKGSISGVRLEGREVFFTRIEETEGWYRGYKRDQIEMRQYKARADTSSGADGIIFEVKHYYEGDDSSMGGGSDPGPVYKASWYADENFGKEKGLNWGVRENTLLTALARSIVDNLSAEKVGKLKLPRPKAA